MRIAFSLKQVLLSIGITVGFIQAGIHWDVWWKSLLFCLLGLISFSMYGNTIRDDLIAAMYQKEMDEVISQGTVKGRNESR